MIFLSVSFTEEKGWIGFQANHFFLNLDLEYPFGLLGHINVMTMGRYAYRPSYIERQNYI